MIFDGQSFIIDGDKVLSHGKRFAADIISLKNFPPGKYKEAKENEQGNTWQDLFQSRLDKTTSPPQLAKLDEERSLEILEALCFGLQEYTTKSGFNKFTVALSGGIDSALVLTIATLSLKPGQEIEAIYMPSIHSSPKSYELCSSLCERLKVTLTTLPIKFIHSATKNLFEQTFKDPFEGLTDENIQARIRGMFIYTRSNQNNSLVINTSNKSEIAVGFSTQYGDSVGAISLLGDLFKTELYQLCHFINKKFNNLIPQELIDRAPTAELREDQKDSQSLPHYQVLDAILELLLNYRFTKSDICGLGFDLEDVTKVIDLYRKSEYKRYQFCPILKVSSKSFGFGYRIPISKNSNFYQSQI